MLNFGDVLRGLFGGQKTQQTQTPLNMNPMTATVGGPFSESITRLMQGGGPQYTGPLNAEMTGQEGNILAQVPGMVGSTDRSKYLSDVLGGRYTNPASNPFFDSYVSALTRPITEAFTEANRQLGGRFTMAGQQTQPESSSAFDRAAALATRGMSNAIGDVTAKFGLGAYEGERGRQQQAVTQSQAELDATQKALQMSSLPRLIQELGIERALALHNSNWQQILETLRIAQQASMPVVGTQGTATGTQFKGAFPQGMGGGGGLGNAATAVMGAVGL